MDECQRQLPDPVRLGALDGVQSHSKGKSGVSLHSPALLPEWHKIEQGTREGNTKIGVGDCQAVLVVTCGWPKVFVDDPRAMGDGRVEGLLGSHY